MGVCLVSLPPTVHFQPFVTTPTLPNALDKIVRTDDTVLD